LVGGAICNRAHIVPQIVQRGYAALERHVFKVLRADLIESSVVFRNRFYDGSGERIRCLFPIGNGQDTVGLCGSRLKGVEVFELGPGNFTFQKSEQQSDEPQIRTGAHRRREEF
jgi:hypothetical protein